MTSEATHMPPAALAVGAQVDRPVRPGDEARRPTALLEWGLHVDCPKCGESNDLARAQHDGEHSIAQHIFNNDWGKLEGWEVTCEGCEHEFTIERVEY